MSVVMVDVERGAALGMERAAPEEVIAAALERDPTADELGHGLRAGRRDPGIGKHYRAMAAIAGCPDARFPANMINPVQDGTG